MNRKLKKIVALILVALLLLQTHPLIVFGSVVQSGTVGTGGAPWRLYNNGDLVVSAGFINSASLTNSPWIEHNASIQHIRFEGPIETGTSLRALFANLTNLTTIEGLDYFDTSGVTTMHSMFLGATSLVSVDLSSWDTSNVSNFTNMFSGTHNLATINISGWDTSSATLMTSMFFDARALTYIDVSSWDTSRVTSMNQMFRHTHSLTTLDVSGWDTSNVTTMRTMFTHAHSLTSLDVSGWDTGNVTNMDRMFQQAYTLNELDVSNWDTSNVTVMAGMFDMASSTPGALSNLTMLDVSGWDTGRVISMANMFRQAIALDGLDVSGWDVSNVTAMNSMFMGAQSLSTLDVSGWDTGNVTNMSFMFRYAHSINNLDVSNWDTSNVTTMSNMFRETNSLTSLDVSNWDTSRVTIMADMFTNASVLTGLDVSGWDTARVTNMSRMFLNARAITYLDVSDWNTSLVTSMASMFSGASSLAALDVSGWDTRNVTDMSAMFAGASSLVALDVSDWQTGNVVNMSSMFSFANLSSSLTVLDVSNWDVSNVVLMQSMFRDARNIAVLDVSNWDTSSVTRTDAMFRDMRALTVLDVSNWDVSNVTRMEGMFQNANNVTSLDFSNWNTESVIAAGMTSMLAGTAALQRIHFGEDFVKPIGANLALPAIANISGFTRNWIKITPPEGTPYLTSAQLIPTADDRPFLPGIWVWERVVGIVLLSVDGMFRFPTVAVGYLDIDPLYVTVSNAGRTPVSAYLDVSIGGANPEAFELTVGSFAQGMTIPVGASLQDAFSVVPVLGLPAGTYTATVTVTGAGINAETFIVSFIVLPDSIENAIFNFDFAVFDGSEQRPLFTVTLEGVTLVEDVDFEIVEDSWINNVNARTWDSENPPSVTIRGIYSFAGEGSEATGTFTIARRPILLAAGNLRFSKVYDGTTLSDPATSTGALAVTGLVQPARVRIVWDSVSDFSNSYVGTHEVALRGLRLESVDALDNWHLNFDLAVDMLAEIPAQITQATITSSPVTRTVTTGATHTITIPIAELTPAPVAPKVLGDIDSIMLHNYSAGSISASATISGGYLVIVTCADKLPLATETITLRFEVQNFLRFDVEVLLNTIQADTSEISYEFTNSPAGAPMVPNNRSVAIGTEDIMPTAVSPLSFTGENNGIIGTWTFGGWTTISNGASTSEPFVMPSNNVHFTGTWTFATSDFEISYEFTNSPAGAPTVPNNRSVAVDTEGITPTAVSPLSFSGENNGVIGTWTFGGWTTISNGANASEPFVMPSNNVHFIGTWTFTASDFEISYEFTNSPVGAPMVPETRTVSAGTPNTMASAPTLTSFAGYDNDVAGTWTFSGWTTESSGASISPFTMPNNNVVFTGTWNFVTAGFEINYSFANAPLGAPAAPSSRSVYAGTYPVSASTLSQTSIAGEYNGIVGNWVFDGWETSSPGVSGEIFIMPNNDVDFVGSWRFEASEFIVSYIFSNSPAIAPSSRYVIAGTPVTPTEVNPSSFPGYDNSVAGVWTFNGWNSTVPALSNGSLIMPNSDLQFIGDWTFVADENGPVDTRGISLSPAGNHTFATVNLGYATQAAHEVTIANIGTLPTGQLELSLSGTGANSFMLSTTDIADIAVADSFAFTVTPVNGLALGVHTATISISGYEIYKTFTVTFIVQAPGGNTTQPLPIEPPEPTYESTPELTPPPLPLLREPELPDELQPAQAPERKLHLAYMFGYTCGNFFPSGILTRAEAATIFVRIYLLDFEHGIAKLPPGMAEFDVFADVRAEHWYYYYVAWAFDAGLVHGDGDNFRPNAPITREEFAAMLARVVSAQSALDKSSFLDTNNISSWAQVYVSDVTYMELMFGDPSGHFRPQANLARAEAATAMNRLLGRINSRPQFEAANILKLENARFFPDVNELAWYFASVVAATNDHYLYEDMSAMEFAPLDE